MPGALGSVVTGFARRDKCWVSGCWLETLQATSLHCSSAVASPCCFQNRRAASLLGSLGDVVAGFARRRGCWARQVASLPGSSGEATIRFSRCTPLCPPGTSPRSLRSRGEGFCCQASSLLASQASLLGSSGGVNPEPVKRGRKRNPL